MRSYSNWQHAQQMLTKKREALVKLELASKNEKLPQAQEEVKEVRKLTSDQPRSQCLSSYRPSSLAPGDGKMRGPGNQVDK